MNPTLERTNTPDTGEIRSRPGGDRTALRAGLVATVLATLPACGGCTPQTPPQAAESADFAWVRVGTNAQGCTQYTKRSIIPGRVADTAIWYRDAEGRYVLDAHACAPENTVQPSSNGASNPTGEQRQ